MLQHYILRRHASCAGLGKHAAGAYFGVPERKQGRYTWWPRRRSEALGFRRCLSCHRPNSSLFPPCLGWLRPYLGYPRKRTNWFRPNSDWFRLNSGWPRVHVRASTKFMLATIISQLVCIKLGLGLAPAQCDSWATGTHRQLREASRGLARPRGGRPSRGFAVLRGASRNPPRDFAGQASPIFAKRHGASRGFAGFRGVSRGLAGLRGASASQRLATPRRACGASRCFAGLRGASRGFVGLRKAARGFAG